LVLPAFPDCPGGASRSWNLGIITGYVTQEATMSILIYNTLTRQKEPFVPANPERVSVYVCGPTVYNLPHIGNARPAVVFDVLVRFLRTRYNVVYVRNITDIDDKINAAAKARGVPIAEVAAEHTAAYHADMSALGTLPPDVEPYATEHIEQMQNLITRLIADGFAYEAEGHVLFRVEAFDGYGQLSRRDRRQLMDGARVDIAPYKEDPGDFVLWKPSTPEMPGWESPWGRGRPGWHIECSAMVAEHLGTTIDIHGGGNDLIFPHHENEIAQSTCAHGGETFCRYWMHNGFVNVDHHKMSKSLGNVVLVRDLLGEAHGEVVRLALLSAHYRQPLDWSDEVLVEARRKLDRLYTALRNAPGWTDSWQSTDPSDEFLHALEDDLNTPKALAALFELARRTNRSDDPQEKMQLAACLRASADLMGLLTVEPEQWFVSDSAANEEFDELLRQRDAARAARDFAEADRIRDELATKGVTIEDGPDGTRWRYLATED
jgi:cysteinyl-tRNA synthetase